VGLQAQPRVLGLDSIFLKKKEKNAHDMSFASLDFGPENQGNVSFGKK